MLSGLQSESPCSIMKRPASMKRKPSASGVVARASASQASSSGERRRYPYKPKKAKANPAAQQQARQRKPGSWWEDGGTRLRAFLHRCLEEGGGATSDALREYVIAKGIVTIGTMCSGTDAPMLASTAIQEVFQDVFAGSTWQAQQLWASDNSEPVHILLDKVMSPPLIFDDCTTLKRGLAWDILSGSYREVPPPMLLVAGFPCQDVTRLAQTSKDPSKRQDVLDGKRRTGSVFQEGIVDFITSRCGQRLEATILENVVGMCDVGKGTRSVLDWVCTELEKVGQYVFVFQICPSDFHFAARRPRLYLVVLPQESLSPMTAQQADEFLQTAMDKCVAAGAKEPVSAQDAILEENHVVVQQYKMELERKDRRQEQQPKSTAKAKRAKAKAKAAHVKTLLTTKGKKKEWAETGHIEYYVRHGIDGWWEKSTPSEATLRSHPSLRALLPRELDILRVAYKFKVELGPEAVQRFIQVQGSIGRTQKNTQQMMTISRNMRCFDTSRLRLLLGVEGLHFQGMHFGERHKKLTPTDATASSNCGFSNHCLMGLAGNGMHVWCVGAALLCTIRLLAEAQHRRRVAATAEQASSFKRWRASSFQRCASDWLDIVWPDSDDV